MSNATSECLSARSAKVAADEPEVLGGACDSRKKPQLLPTVCELKARAVCMFTNRPSGVVGSGDDAVPTMDATFELVLLAQQAVHELWEQRRADICCSPARADLQLDKEEGIGYLIGDILCGSLLPDEARAIGKRAGKLATKAKGELESMKAQAKAKRCRVRSAAAKDANLTAGLEDAVATIDATASVSRAATLPSTALGLVNMVV